MRVTRCLALCVVFVALVIPAWADQQHKHDSESGDPGKLGKVSFATTCAPAQQKDFERAVAKLHSFWYEESEKAFAAVAAADPGCAIAHWGVAMSLLHPLWYPPDAATLKRGSEAVERAEAAGAKSERERDYIAAIAAYYRGHEQQNHRSRMAAYEQAMEKLAAKHADDREATVFYALALLGAADPKDKTLARQKKAGALLEPLFAKNPDHPGLAHYIIHAYDYPPLAARAVEAARRYSKIAPEAPHALHMPSHIFTRLGMWQDSIVSNRASAAAAHAYGQRSGMRGAWDQELHAMDYLVYAYLQTGQDELALRTRDEAQKLAAGAPSGNTANYAVSAIPARCALELGRWKEAVALTPAANASPAMHAITWMAVATGAGRLKDVDKAKAAHDKLAAIHEALVKSSDVQERDYWSEQVEVQRREAAAWLAYAQGKNDEAVSLMRSAADLEDSTEKHPVTPGQVVPAREMLGDLLLAVGKPAEALPEYESVLASAPNRLNALYRAARAAEAVGRKNKAKQYYAKLLDNAHPSAHREEVELARAQAGTPLKKAGKH